MNQQGPHVGLIGLAVMGENLALNIARNGFPLVVYNRTTLRTEEYLAGAAAGTGIAGVATLPELVAALARPRQIILMVKAGVPVDAVLAELAPLLDPGDIVVDGGNSYFRDTERREAELAAQNLHFVGMGVSGGELGALWGPSLMPGGPREAYDVLEPMLVAIAAKSPYGPCVSYIGPGGSGHYVKMIHNGIEYGDMQLIAETYDVMRTALGMPAEEMASVFADWNTRKLASYLIEVTADVLRYVDTETEQPLVDLILDAAEQKGTGRWTIESALDLASPVPTIDAAVTARNLSALRGLRVQASEVLLGPPSPGGPEQAAAVLGGADGPDQALSALEDALYFSKISSYAQGMALLESGKYRLQLESRPVRDRPDLDRRLHHPRRVSGRHHAGLPRESGSGQHAARSPDRPPVRRDRRRRSPRHRGGPVLGHSGAGNVVGARLLRHLAPAGAAGQSHPGPARLLRRAYLPTQRSRGRLPHPLAWRRATRGASPLANRHRPVR